MKDKEIDIIVDNSINFLSVRKYLYIFVKRLFDIIVSLVGMVFLVPIYIVIRLFCLLTRDNHKILFYQERIGKDGKIFKLYKFRSMIPNAEEELKKLLKKDKKLREEYEENKKLFDDPRITKVGKFIRRFSIDELPQLINVFIGNMSIIGNRPYLVSEKKDMGSFYKYIVKTKPGITGYWQVSGRSDVTFRKRLQLEKYYSVNQSLGLDFKIFFKTFKVVLCGRGAK